MCALIRYKPIPIHNDILKEYAIQFQVDHYCKIPIGSDSEEYQSSISAQRCLSMVFVIGELLNQYKKMITCFLSKQNNAAGQIRNKSFLKADCLCLTSAWLKIETLNHNLKMKLNKNISHAKCNNSRLCNWHNPMNGQSTWISKGMDK